jgi:hypothetical protein
MDTVVIILKQEDYLITRPDQFNPRLVPINGTSFDQRISFLKNYKGVKKYVQNPLPEMRKGGLVYPNLSMYERVRGQVYSCDLHVSISLSKLLYGHSFDNVYTEQLDEVCMLLSKRLAYMGVETKPATLKQATVNTMHYSLNVVFPSEEHTRIFLDRMNKASIGGWFENNMQVKQVWQISSSGKKMS